MKQRFAVCTSWYTEASKGEYDSHPPARAARDLMTEGNSEQAVMSPEIAAVVFLIQPTLCSKEKPCSKFMSTGAAANSFAPHL
jgi:hypothetical protein